MAHFQHMIHSILPRSTMKKIAVEKALQEFVTLSCKHGGFTTRPLVAIGFDPVPICGIEHWRSIIMWQSCSEKKIIDSPQLFTLRISDAGIKSWTINKNGHLIQIANQFQIQNLIITSEAVDQIYDWD